MKAKKLIKVGFCVAYDWRLLKYSLPLIYNASDVICLSYDKENISWSGKKYTWNQWEFESLVKSIDIDNKVQFIQENYFSSDRTPMQNEVYQRNRLAYHMKEGGWHLQIDCDELFIDFHLFVKYLQNFTKKFPVNICCPSISFYKNDANGFYFINPENFNKLEFMQLASNRPKYEYGRKNGYFNIYTAYPILHLTWAREISEMREKFTNWGHSMDASKDQIEAIYSTWISLTKDNYKTFKNLHLIDPPAWPSLEFIPVTSIDELIKTKSFAFKLPISRYKLILKNSITISRLSQLLKILAKNIKNHFVISL